MAANDYYNPQYSQPQPQHYQSYGHEVDAAPPYSSQSRPAELSPVSPFEGPFDDHVYPARPRDSQYSFGQDSINYSHGVGGRHVHGSVSSFRDDIPLREQPRHTGETDHVYDAGDPRITPMLVDPMETPKSRLGFGFFKKDGRIPWVVYIFTIIQFSVFIAEIVKNAQLTGSPIMTQPSFNPMIGPSTQVLINMGARYVPCMHDVPGVQSASPPLLWPCPNTTTNDINDPSNHCTLSDLCGFGGVPNPGTSTNGAEPNQWFRFILPIFLHAGLIHIGFNMLLQLTIGREMEVLIGSIRFFLVYISAGIFGFVMGGNFAASGIASTGASGSLFGVIALLLLDLLYNWKNRERPWVDLAWIVLDITISFVLGLLPGLDNFSHIGGFLMGLVAGICILHSPAALRERIKQDEPPYTPVRNKFNEGIPADSGVISFVESPVGFFKGRKPLWWAWWLIRAAALAAVFAVFIVLLNNFYIYRKTCSWCKYLSCLLTIGVISAVYKLRTLTLPIKETYSKAGVRR